MLARFVRERLRGYAEGRNHPERDATSQLSPYLHFGHIGPREVARAGTRCRRTARGPRRVPRGVHRPARARRQLRALQPAVRPPRRLRAVGAPHAGRARGGPARSLVLARAPGGGRHPRPALERRAGADGRHRLDARLRADVLGEEDPRVDARPGRGLRPRRPAERSLRARRARPERVHGHRLGHRRQARPRLGPRAPGLRHRSGTCRSRAPRASSTVPVTSAASKSRPGGPSGGPDTPCQPANRSASASRRACSARRSASTAATSATPSSSTPSGAFVEWVPVCPEVELGLGTPRESLRLVREGDARATGEHEERGATSRHEMRRWTRDAASRSSRAETSSGYVLKKDSPSCGMERVKVYGEAGMADEERAAGSSPRRSWTGFPLLPVEEEGRLSRSAAARELRRARLRLPPAARSVPRRWTAGDLVRFHTAHKLALLAHCSGGVRGSSAGWWRARSARSRRRSRPGTASCSWTPWRRWPPRASTPTCCSTWRATSRTLLDADEKQELLGTHRGLPPRPRARSSCRSRCCKHHVRRHKVAYLAGQVYLDPHPKELMLRNHV